MLEFLQRSGNASERKVRLFGVACCRRIWHLLPDERSRRAVEVAERFADGLVTEAETNRAAFEAAAVPSDATQGIPKEVRWRVAEAVEFLLSPPEEAVLLWVCDYVAVAMEGEQFVKEGATPEMLAAWSDECYASDRIMGCTAINPNAIIADILREVIGPIPFRRVSIAPAVLHWNGEAIPNLARGFYDDRRFQDLPILADALEEAGCTNAHLLSHCRGPGPHVRGCWALDLILCKT
jgi:hypothetical protein